MEFLILDFEGHSKVLLAKPHVRESSFFIVCLYLYIPYCLQGEICIDEFCERDTCTNDTQCDDLICLHGLCSDPECEDDRNCDQIKRFNHENY